VTAPSSRRLVALVTAFVALSGCSSEGLLFRQDRRLKITSPASGARVTLPLTIRWTMERPPPGSHFAVFVDRAPQRPGKTLAWLDRNVPVALRGRQTGVFETTDTSFTVAELTRRSDTASVDRNRHEVTIVLVDGGTRRIGETAAFVDFVVTEAAT
jgi:hypothetical protein